MKKVIYTILVIIILFGSIFFLIRLSSRSLVKELAGDKDNSKVEVNSSQTDKLLNKKVPYFDLPSLLGERIKLSQYIDKPFIIVFWATWNIESANQLKIIDDYILSNKKEDKLIPIISINSQEEESLVRSFVKRGDYKVPVGLDINGNVGENFSIRSLPVAFFVDRDGIIREIYAGVLNKSMLVDKLEQLLK
ncbi:TlpA family protein disulfide reductase [Candidatus Nomurabacteria bacterium]|nr:TlpA family protein disulfide reductase [Candidatus Nomurabacteria bacterium]